MSVPPFTHLTVRSCYSLRDGAIRPRELAAAAALLGMTHLTLTDRDGLYGAVRFAKACQMTGVTPVFGADLALVPDPRRPGWEITRAGRERLPAREHRHQESRAGPAPDTGWVAGRSEAGLSLHTADDPRTRRPSRGPAFLEDDAARVIFLARTQTGYGNLCRTISAAHRDLRSCPHLTWEDATARPEGLYVLLGADSPVGRLVAAGRLDAAAAESRRFIEAFGAEQVLIGVRHHLVRGDDLRAARMVRLADELGLSAIAVNDVRYLREDDAYLADVLACVRAQVPVATHHVGRTTAEGWLKTAAELLRIPVFRDRPDLLTNAQQVAESCQVTLGLHDRPHVPRLTGLTDTDAARELHVRCWVGVHQRYERLTPEVTDRLRRELAMVAELGLHDYFLTVADIVAGIRELSVLTACRGSAASSLICYALRISDVDPIANGLVFERFMNPYRDELPDIDIDVESARREDVYRMVMDRYGEERTACVAMVETFQARMAVREVGKALGLPPEEIDLVARAFRQVGSARDIRRAMATLPELRGSRLDAGQLETLFQVAERIDGFPRHLAMHPCGILLADTYLQDRTPVERSANGFAMSQFDKDDVAAMGLLKLDVLAVRLLSAMRHALDLVSTTRGTCTDFHAIPSEDPAVYELLRTTRSIGVFQVESPGQRELLGRLQPDRFDDLVVEISLFRPGPVKADMVGPFVARRLALKQRSGRAPDRALKQRSGRAPDHSLKQRSGRAPDPARKQRSGRALDPARKERSGETAYVHPMLEAALGDTFGVVIFHEQVMQVIAALTGCDLAYADQVRRDLADDDKLAAHRSWALVRALQQGIDLLTAKAVWKQVESFASFGFCKAHAAAFAVPTYRSAWLKVHALPEFIAGLLTYDPGMYPQRLLLEEARQFGVAVLGPDVNVSAHKYTVEAIDDVFADRLLELRDADGRWCDPLPPGWCWPLPPAGDAGRPVPPAGDAGRPVPPTGSDAGSGEQGKRWAIRIGLQDVKGMSDAEREHLLAGRPYTSLADLRDRGGLARPTAENLARAGALDALGSGCDRRAILLEVEERWRGGRRRSAEADHQPEQAAFDLAASHRPRLPATTEADVVRDELEVLGLDVSRHVIAFYEALFPVLGITRIADLTDRGDGQRVRVAGVRVALQSPPVRSGQRVLFLSLDDRTGTTQCNFFERVLDTTAWVVLNAWLTVVEGRVRRQGRSVTVLADQAWDLTDLWRAWCEGRLSEALARSGLPALHQRRERQPAGLRASMFASGSR